MQSSRDFPAPAKINLFLHVVGRRSDGYHLLQTAFHFLDYGDTLEFDVRNDGQIRLLTPLPDVPDEKNLVVRAARLLQTATHSSRGADIRLQKCLPLGGGLGGGSSNAATTLIALNELWQTGLDRNELQRLGLQLGADVPIFIHGHSAFAEGVGEKFTNIEPPPAWYLVLVPPVSISTAEIFSAPELRRDTSPMKPQDWRPGIGHNDLEIVAGARFPAVRDYLDLLRPFAAPRMSGSGACVFAEFPGETAAKAAFSALPAGIRAFVAEGRSTHPLAGTASH